MDVINFSETRANLKSVMDRVVRDRTPVVVSRKNGESVVMVSLADWNATEETNYLLSQKVNSTRLADAMNELDAGEGKNANLSVREAHLRLASLAGLPVPAEHSPGDAEPPERPH